jgi:hypothetical protein
VPSEREQLILTKPPVPKKIQKSKGKRLHPEEMDFKRLTEKKQGYWPNEIEFIAQDILFTPPTPSNQNSGIFYSSYSSFKTNLLFILTKHNIGNDLPEIMEYHLRRPGGYTLFF